MLIKEIINNMNSGKQKNNKFLIICKVCLKIQDKFYFARTIINALNKIGQL